MARIAGVNLPREKRLEVGLTYIYGIGPATARKVAGLIARSELHDDVVSKRSDDDLLHDWDRDEWRRQEGRIAQIFTAFIKRNEAKG